MGAKLRRDTHDGIAALASRPREKNSPAKRSGDRQSAHADNLNRIFRRVCKQFLVVLIDMHLVIFKVILVCYFQSNFLPVNLRPTLAASRETSAVQFGWSLFSRRQTVPPSRPAGARSLYSSLQAAQSRPRPAKSHCRINTTPRHGRRRRNQRPPGRALIKTEGFRRASQPRTRQMKLISPRRKPLHVICRSFKSPMMSRKFRQEMRFRI